MVNNFQKKDWVSSGMLTPNMLGLDMKKIIFSCVAIVALSSVAFYPTGNKRTTELTPMVIAFSEKTKQ